MTESNESSSTSTLSEGARLWCDKTTLALATWELVATRKAKELGVARMMIPREYAKQVSPRSFRAAARELLESMVGQPDAPAAEEIDQVIAIAFAELPLE